MSYRGDGEIDGTARRDNDGGFPRFLNGDRAADPAGPLPPPLPRRPWFKGRGIAPAHGVRVVTIHGVRLAPAHGVRLAVASAASFAAVALASLTLLTEAHDPSALQPPPIVETRNEVADAVQIVTAFEARLAYAPNIAGRLDASQLETSERDALVTVAAHAERAGGQPLDPVAGLISRSILPSGHVVEVAETPVTETPVAEVQVTKVHVTKVPVTSVTVTSEPVTIVAVTEAGATDMQVAKPLKRRPQLFASKAERVATAEARSKRRAKGADDAHKTKAASQPIADDGKPDRAGAPGGDEKPAGPLSKFFAWLKSGAKPSAGSSDTPSAIGLAPQN